MADAESVGGAAPSTAQPVRGQLDVAAVGRLRELDPTGEGDLLRRVCNAFETSLNRLLPQLMRARDAGDAASVRLVAHTLKSSSATVGAQALSAMCIELEAQARELRLAEAEPGIDQILLEAEAVRAALRGLSGAANKAAGQGAADHQPAGAP
jgi:HPt (histidine-containing phosphotransfer) domain-containing protein